MTDHPKNLPAVRVVKGVPAETLRDRVTHANEAVAEGASKTLTVVFGLLPAFAAFGLIVALAWGFAMFQSP
jgi:hypothetical protein